MTKLRTAFRRLLPLVAGVWLIAAPLPAAADGNAVGHTVKDAVQKRAYRLTVELPRGYEAAENADRRYPVVYMLDGPNFLAAATGIIRFPTGTGLLEPVILVGISYANGENGLNSRIRDFTPTVDVRLAQYETGGGLGFRNYLENAVIPFIEKEYRADPARRTLFGHSLGGSFGAWVMLTRPELFSSYILASPSLWYGGQQIFRQLENDPPARDTLRARVFLATGAFETAPANMVADQFAFTKALQTAAFPGLSVEARIIPGVHHELTGAIAFAEGMNWLYVNPGRGSKAKRGN